MLACLLSFIVAGCEAGPTPRLIELVGEEAFAPGVMIRSKAPESSAKAEWMGVTNIGLVVHSDATAQNAAPAILSQYLETLARRTEEFLRQHCAFQDMRTAPPLSKPVNLSHEVKTHGQ